MSWTIFAAKLLIVIVCFTLLITINPVSFVLDYPPEIPEEYYRARSWRKRKQRLQRQ